MQGASSKRGAWVARGGGLLLCALGVVGCSGGGSSPSLPDTPSGPNTPSSPANTPPVANAGPDQVVSAGVTVNLSGTASNDPDGTITTFAWSQTGGTPVSLTGANTATPTFAAPGVPGTLTFQLTVTDNQGASHSDAVSVAVNAMLAPTIGRQPTSPHTIEHGAALIFVDAAGDDLNYEWRYSASGVIAKTGPEPYLLRTGLTPSNDGQCFYVVISNAVGSVTSEPGCLSVEALDDDFIITTSDDDITDEAFAAIGYGNVLIGLTELATGVLVGAVGPLHTVVTGMFAMPSPAENCGYRGMDLGSVVDGVPVTQSTFLPLGRHSFSHAWDDCHETSDDVSGTHGAFLITYDFPTKFGEGTFTIHASGYRGLNGVMTVTVTRTMSDSGGLTDEFDIRLGNNLGSYNLRASEGDRISVRRVSNSEQTIFRRAIVDFGASLGVYDAQGAVGTLLQDKPGVITLKFDQTSEGDNGVDPYSAEGLLSVGLLAHGTTYHILTLKPGGGANGWGFNVVPEPECEADVCAEWPETP